MVAINISPFLQSSLIAARARVHTKPTAVVQREVTHDEVAIIDPVKTESLI
jgi:hypothetical protein